MKKVIKVLFPFMVLALTSCSGKGSTEYSAIKDGSEGWGGGAGEYYPPSSGDSEWVGGESGEDPSPIEPGGEPEEPVDKSVPAGQLTCSALDDNLHYDYWKSLAESTQEGKGIFQNYKEKFAFNTYNRLDLTIKNGNYIKVAIKGENNFTYVDNLDKAYLFAKEDKDNYDIEITYLDKDNKEQKLEKNVTPGEVIDLENEHVNANLLEIMFVIDATGSMGDEMTYIKAEIDDVIGKVKEDNPGATISLAMMVYRDKGDEYVTKYNDFTQNIAAQQDFLSKQRANGGGDFEEAVDVALNEAINKQWSSKSTKLLFHVADAPSHDKDVPSWNESVMLAAQKGIKIIPVASSGIDKQTEYFFRSEALITGSQYVFLTNHSGIGGEHLEPTINVELPVEFLNDCLTRLINGYYSGEFAEPVEYFQKQNQQ